MLILVFAPCYLQVLTPQIDTLTEKQIMHVCNLQLSSQQAEDALSQGLDKLQQTLAETLTSGPFGSSGGVDYMGQMITAMGKMEELISFVNQVIQHLYSSITTIVVNSQSSSHYDHQSHCWQIIILEKILEDFRFMVFLEYNWENLVNLN